MKEFLSQFLSLEYHFDAIIPTLRVLLVLEYDLKYPQKEIANVPDENISLCTSPKLM